VFDVDRADLLGPLGWLPTFQGTRTEVVGDWHFRFYVRVPRLGLVEPVEVLHPESLECLGEFRRAGLLPDPAAEGVAGDEVLTVEVEDLPFRLSSEAPESGAVAAEENVPEPPEEDEVGGVIPDEEQVEEGGEEVVAAAPDVVAPAVPPLLTEDEIAAMDGGKVLEQLIQIHRLIPAAEIPEPLFGRSDDDLREVLRGVVTSAAVHGWQQSRKLPCRPTISVHERHLSEVSLDAIDAISVANIPPFLFRRGGHLVRVERDEEGRAGIQAVNEHALRGIMDRTASWISTRIRGGVATDIAVDPPLSVVRDLLSLPGDEWSVPSLIGISSCPIIHLDGSIHAAEGYDSESRTYFAPKPGFVLSAVSKNPTKADLQMSLDLILEMFHDFPFTDEAARWNAVGAFLTIVLRPLIDGPALCWLVDKPQAGSGASLLQQAVYVAATGEEPPATTAPKSPEEWEKRTLSVLLSGAPLYVWDNLEGNFRSDTLASVLTAREWKGRLLGKSEDVSVPARTVWFANGNNVQIGGDLARRVFVSRIDAQMAMPWQRQEFRHPDLLGWIRANRGRLVAAALTLARSWILAGCPKPQDVPPVGGFEGWRDTVGGVLEHAGVTEFLSNAMEVYIEADSEMRQWEGFLVAVDTVYHGQPWTVAELSDRLGKERKDPQWYPTLISEALPDALADAWTSPRRSFSHAAGRALRGVVGRRYPCGLMVAQGRTVQRATQWIVTRCEGIELDQTHQTHTEGGAE